MTRAVDRALDDLGVAMRRLRKAVHGIPYRENGFKNTHDRLAREMAMLAVLLDSARPRFRDR